MWLVVWHRSGPECQAITKLISSVSSIFCQSRKEAFFFCIAENILKNDQTAKKTSKQLRTSNNFRTSKNLRTLKNFWTSKNHLDVPKMFLDVQNKIGRPKMFGRMEGEPNFRPTLDPFLKVKILNIEFRLDSNVEYYIRFEISSWDFD